MIRLGVVGFGGYGWNLIETIRKVSAQRPCRIVAAADTRMQDFPDKVECLTRDGVELFDDALKMYRDLRGKCDAVYIATSISSHAPLVVAAAEAGYHVHLEKPPAATVQEVDRMIEAVEKAGVLCLVGFQAVHAKDVRFVKDCIVSGRLGKVHTIACRAGWPRNRKYYQRNEWAGKLTSGRHWVLDGPATNALAHQLTNVLLWASPREGQYAVPTAVRAELYAARGAEPPANRSHDTAAIEILTADGPKAYFIASHCSESLFGPITEIHAERGTLVWQSDRQATVRYADGHEETCPHDPEQRLRMVTNFLDALERGDGAGLRCTLRDARNMVLALNGAHESSRGVHAIDPKQTYRADDDTDAERTVVRGMDDLLNAAGQTPCLFSDLPDRAAWTVATEPFALAAYDRFPRQFRAD